MPEGCRYTAGIVYPQSYERGNSTPGALRCHYVEPAVSLRNGAEGQNRTVDTSLFRAVLYQLSYLGTLGAGVEKRWTIPQKPRSGQDSEQYQRSERDRRRLDLDGHFVDTISISSTSKTNVAPGLMAGGDPRSP